jgi:DNA-binding beta-propeller fold protein YncE
MLLGPQTAAVDPQNNEILVGDPSSGSILVYARDANGNVPPKRILRGPKTGLREVVGVAVDPKRNLLLAINMGATHDEHGVFIFNRTDSGDVAPRAVIGGSETGIAHVRQLVVDSERGKIYVAVIGTNYHAERPYVENTPRKDYSWDDRKDDSAKNRNKPTWSDDTHGFIGVWDINDHGNVPPRAAIKGVNSHISACGGIAIDPKEGLIIGVGNNMYTVHLLPQFFTPQFWDRKPKTE